MHIILTCCSRQGEMIGDEFRKPGAIYQAKKQMSEDSANNILYTEGSY